MNKKVENMKLNFSVNYRTAWGESVNVVIDYVCTDGARKRQDIRMTTQDGEHWSVETAIVESRHRGISRFAYYYQIEAEDGYVLRREWTLVPRLIACASGHDYRMDDEWRATPFVNHLFSAAYLTAEGMQNDSESVVTLPTFRRTAIFRIMAPQIEKGKKVALCGNHPALGSWSLSRYVPMQYAGQSVWTVAIDIEVMHEPIEYKYVVVDEKTHNLEDWEEGDNRKADFYRMPDGEVRVLDGGIMRRREKLWKSAGVVVPVFALRSERSCGVGDFGDLKLMADWAAANGMKIIQLLPVNDTTMQHNWNDSYPYNTISVNALHPQYVNLDDAGRLANNGSMLDFNRRRSELNNLSFTDYEAVEKVKTEYLRELYADCEDKLASDEQFAKFKKENEDWLVPYAAFCILRDKYHTARFSDWKEDAVYNRRRVETLVKQREAEYIYWVQYILHNQLKEAAEYARNKNVTFMADIPIGISADSVEAWSEGALFNLDMQSGSMPDKGNAKGQNWCFPTYNWDAMMRDGCRWWQKRLQRMEQYFGAVRIDHVLGFFRIWEIPHSSVDALLGHFSPSMPLSPNDINARGLTFRHEFMTRPFINWRVLTKTFGIHAEYVRNTYLREKGYGLYDLRSEFDTQRKIYDAFNGRNDENSVWIRDGLCRLVANVLFVEDSRWPNMFHPRVQAYNALVFEALTSEERQAFMTIYNDYFYERHNEMWGALAYRKLSMVLERTNMLVTAEDLGVLPDCVQPTLDALRILTLEVQTLPKQHGLEFAHLEANPYLSVATISTHDMPPMRLWWQERPEAAQHYYRDRMQKEGRPPVALTTTLAEEIVSRHLYSPSMLCLLSLQDWLAVDAEMRNPDPRSERINIPGDCYNRWSYRMHVNIEQLIADEQLNKKLRTMVERSKRNV